MILRTSDFSVKRDSWSKNPNIRFAFPAMFQIKNSVNIYIELKEKVIRYYSEFIFQNITKMKHKDLGPVFYKISFCR